MKSGPEAKFRQKVCAELKKCNALIYPIIGSGINREDRIYSQNPGMSDIIMVHRYTGIIFLEFKASKGILSEVQRRFLQDINDRAPFSGFVVREVTNVERMGHKSKFLGWLENELGEVYPNSLFDEGIELIQAIKELRR